MAHDVVELDFVYITRAHHENETSTLTHTIHYNWELFLLRQRVTFYWRPMFLSICSNQS